MHWALSLYHYPTSVGAVSLAAWSRFPCPTISRSQVWKMDAHKFLLEFLDIKNTRRSVDCLTPLPTDFRLCPFRLATCKVLSMSGEFSLWVYKVLLFSYAASDKEPQVLYSP